jgi:hypothetical protein
MTKQRHDSHEYREHAHAEAYWEQRTVMLRVLGMLVQLLHVILADAVVVHGLRDCTRRVAATYIESRGTGGLPRVRHVRATTRRELSLPQGALSVPKIQF